jgi:hypothetical protein
MTRRKVRGEGYADRLARWARALAAGEPDAVRDALADGSSPSQVEMFVEGNFDKRCQLLAKQLEFVAAAFDDLEELLHEYLHAVPMAADATGASDADRFLAWLERTQQPTPEQRDYLACQRARHAVEFAARTNRHAHLRFQELWSVAGRLSEELGTNPGLRVHLNPLRVWSRFETPALLGGAAAPPADVLFFAVRSSVSTAVLDAGGQELVRALEAGGPCALDEWAALCPQVGEDGVASVARDLAAMGLVAFS